MATYICAELLEKKIVDHVFSIKEASEPGTHYKYAVSSTKADLLIASKTRYFPVTLATVLTEIDNLKGNIAIVGVACFIKSIRLAQNADPKLKEKITFLIGIICGGVKSRFFTEYLASKMDIKVAKLIGDSIETFGWISDDDKMIRSPNGAVWIRISEELYIERD